MNDSENFNETSLSKKKSFYSHLNMEHITHADYTHWKKVRKDFEIKKIRRISLPVYSKRYLSACKCMGEL